MCYWICKCAIAYWMMPRHCGHRIGSHFEPPGAQCGAHLMSSVTSYRLSDTWGLLPFLLQDVPLCFPFGGSLESCSSPMLWPSPLALDLLAIIRSASVCFINYKATTAHHQSPTISLPQPSPNKDHFHNHWSILWPRQKLVRQLLFSEYFKWFYFWKMRFRKYNRKCFLLVSVNQTTRVIIIKN